ncbi:TfoX/Sxy family protein [Jatrophihabitans fulvus]
MSYDADDAERVRALAHRLPGVSEQRMFGGLAFLVGGHMAVTVSGRGGLMVRCERDATDALLAEPGAAPMVMSGREVRGWVRVDATALDDAAFETWVRRGLDHAAGLPPKG